MRPRPAPGVAGLFRTAVAFELWGPGDPTQLRPAERALVERAVPSRVSQFAAGRQCARAAMEALDLPATALLRSDQRAPAWPPLTRGTISHTADYAVAAMTLTGTASDHSIGVDAEVVGRVGAELHRRLFTPGEQAWLRSLSSSDQPRVATELFGLKESFYKAQFPVTGGWVGFLDVEISPYDRGFVLQPFTDFDLFDAVRWPVIGRTLVRDELVVSAVEVVVAPTWELTPQAPPSD